MARVNPPPHLRIPKRFFEDPETRPYFQQLEFIVFQLWTRTGGGSDAIEDGNIKELYPWIPLADDESLSSINLYPKINLNGKVFDVISVTADHTTSGNEILICNNTSIVTVTLNATPDDEEEVIVKRRDKEVIVTGVKKIDGDITKRIVRRYDSPHLIFTGEADEYSVI